MFACVAAFLTACISALLLTPLVRKAAVAGALGGFLVFNFPPAKIFLGDGGSMLTGL